MDIRYLAQRSQDIAAYRSNRSAAAEARQTVEAGQVAAAAQTSRGPAAETSAQQPATLSRFTPAGRLLNVLQSFEQRRPEETRNILSNIADKLRSDAQNAGRFSERLTNWADRFQAAADSGDVSKLVPRFQPQSGLRAYQEAQRPEADPTVEQVAETAETQANAAVDRAPVAVAEPADAVTATAQNADVRDRTEKANAERSLDTRDIRNRPVTVPDSARETSDRSSDFRSRPVTVPESSKLLTTQ